MNRILIISFLCTFLSALTVENHSSCGQEKHMVTYRKSIDKEEKVYQGRLMHGKNSFVIRFPLINDNLFISTYGIKSGNLLLELNGKFLDFEHFPKNIKTDFMLELLKTFKINDVDHNHSLCYVKNDLSCSLNAEMGIIHDKDKCYIEKMKIKHTYFQVITIPNRMINLLSTL